MLVPKPTHSENHTAAFLSPECDFHPWPLNLKRLKDAAGHNHLIPAAGSGSIPKGLEMKDLHIGHQSLMHTNSLSTTAGPALKL